MIKVKKDPYEEKACEYLNEAECEETIDDDMEDLDKLQKEHFDEDKDSFE